MQNEILLAVQKEKTLIQDKRMHKYLYEASLVDVNSSFGSIDSAFRSLHIARGFYHSLNGLGLLSEGNKVTEDMERIEAKLKFVKEEKRKTFGSGWKSPIKRA